jgi:hypothetical protein
VSRASIEYRIRHKTRTNDAGCWVWLGLKSPDGYGRTAVGGRDVHTHRAVYECLVGPIPDGLQLDHLCRNRACCNPAHLEPVTQIENIRRGAAGPRPPGSICFAGHDVPNGGACVECKRRRQSEWRQRRRAQGVAT